MEKQTLDEVSAKPDLIGTHGRAWKVPLKLPTSVAVWMIEAEWAHPAWHSYVLSFCHLRNLPSESPPIIYLDGATHELVIHALDPQVNRDAQIAKRAFAVLDPANFAAQVICPSDAAAEKLAEQTVDKVINGKLHPDTDFIRQWIDLFGDNMVRK